MGFLASLAVGLVLMVVGELIRPKQNPPNATASSLDDFDIPTAEEGRAIPVFFGKVKITGPNVTWYGDLESVAIKKKVKTGMFSSKKQTIGYKYYMGMQIAICHAWDDITLDRITFDDEEPIYTRAAEPDGAVHLTFADPNFYGGKESGGGIEGSARFYKGNVGQSANAYMTAQVGEPFPPYEGLCHLVMEHTYLGTSNYIKNIAFVLSAYPNSLGVTGGHHRVGDDCNPMCILYELVTNPVWGCGVPSANVDMAQWRQVAEVLYTEGFGISTIYNGASNAKDMISDVLRHVDGVQLTDPETGLLIVRLARNDYVKENLPVYDGSVFTQGIKFSRPSWSETKNHIKGTYIDRENNFSEATISQADLANVTQRGGEMAVETVDYSGFNSFEPAARAVSRTLKALSYPLARVSGPINLTASSVKRPTPSDLFVLRWPEMGVYDGVFRVISVGYEDVAQNIYTIEATEDIFSISHSAFTDPGPSEWVQPAGAPNVMIGQSVMEAPYFFTESETADIITLGARTGGLDLGYQVWLSSSPVEASFVASATVTDFTAVSSLASDYPRPANGSSDSGFSLALISGAQEIDSDINSDDKSSGRTMALLRSETTEELVVYGSINTATGTVGDVWRGVLDTVPQDHPAGTDVYFLESGFGFGNADAITSAQTIYAKLLPYNGKGLLPLASANTLPLPIVLRAQRPIPPGNVKISGSGAWTAPSVDGAQFTVQWSNRSRMDPVIIKQDDSARPLVEDGAGFKLRFYRVSDGALLVESSDISGQATQASVSLAYAGAVRMELSATRNGLESYQWQVFQFNVTTAGAQNAISADNPVYVLDGGSAGG